MVHPLLSLPHSEISLGLVSVLDIRIGKSGCHRRMHTWGAVRRKEGGWQWEASGRRCGSGKVEGARPDPHVPEAAPESRLVRAGQEFVGGVEYNPEILPSSKTWLQGLLTPWWR